MNFLTLVVPKGISIATITFIFTTMVIQYVDPILDLILVFMLYSIILSSFIVKFEHKFLVTPHEVKNGTSRKLRDGEPKGASVRT